MSTRACASCGAEFARRRGDSETQWAGRRFCSRRCYWDSMRTPAEAKMCEHCGERFERPLERTDRHWAARRYCSQTCSAAARTEPLQERIWQHIAQGPGCWAWTGNVRHPETGRGALADDDGNLVYSYRAVYELLVGPIPPELVAHHTCEDPNCVNPAHLELVTQAEHVRLHALGRAAA